MAYNTQNVIKDVLSIPVPQQYDPLNDVFKPDEGNFLSTVTTLQSIASATGQGTAMPVNGYSMAMLAISGTFVATITFQAVGPDGNTYPINGKNILSGVVSNTATTTGLYEINTRGLTSIYANITSYTSGTVTIKGQSQLLPSSDQQVSSQITGSSIAVPVDLQYSEVTLQTQLTGSNATKITNDGTSAGNAVNLFQTQGDGISTANYSMSSAAMGLAYNESTGWDRVRNNTQGTLLASAARTATTTTPQQANYNSKGVHVILSITNASGTGGLHVTIRGIDPISGSVYSMNAYPTALTATGLYAFELYPGASAPIPSAATSTSVIVQRTAASLPRTWYVAVIVDDSSSYTYSLGYALIN